jgi:IMP dehydrogenase
MATRLTSSLPADLTAELTAGLDLPRSSGRRLRHAYGFDDVALVPGSLTVDPEETDLSWQLGPHRLALPILASAMDGVVDPRFAVALGQAGGLAVLNLEGLQTRYENPDEQLQQIAEADKDRATALLQDLYRAPLRDDLVARRVREIKAGGVLAAVSSTPANAARLGRVAAEAGADVFIVQSTVSTARYRTRGESLDLARLCKEMPIPVVVGNCVSFSAALELMQTGVAGLLIGVGPGSACTSREVLGVGVPQVTATIDTS